MALAHALIVTLKEESLSQFQEGRARIPVYLVDDDMPLPRLDVVRRRRQP